VRDKCGGRKKQQPTVRENYQWREKAESKQRRHAETETEKETMGDIGRQKETTGDNGGCQENKKETMGDIGRQKRDNGRQWRQCETPETMET
jgi:hypothetical protein